MGFDEVAWLVRECAIECSLRQKNVRFEVTYGQQLSLQTRGQ